MSHPIANVDALGDLEAQLALAAWLEPRIDDWTGPGSAAGGGRSAVADSDPTLAAVEALLDGGTDTTKLLDKARLFIERCDRIKQLIAENNGSRHELAPMGQERAKRRVNDRTTPSTVGFCEADDVYCDGSDEYRSTVGGLCGACRKAFQRWPRSSDPGGDRRAFIEQRRRQVEERRSKAS